ncbi:MAG TPA: hypothetical protein VGU61_19895 [Noviherbaspirillum sp.]|jgi:hypothetical protein|uniref:hypothetical protein n=1 Tax=Noviherbaspirillum sp. TaxID=1926288 RepID=UPI002DDCFFDB|nr:hypothetical protein [Noviherbaspirillum sp.]HEV2612535.1 hypothetical protein [Noviherbaspirillum sp.]
MATVKQEVGTRTALTATGLSTLASATYVASNVLDVSANDPLDVIVELAITPGTVAGNKQAVLFAQASLDNTNFQTGPASGTTTTDEAVLTLIGTLPLPTNATLQRKAFSVAAAFGGVLPPYLKFVVKNDSGAAFTTGTIHTAEVSGTVV